MILILDQKHYQKCNKDGITVDILLLVKNNNPEMFIGPVEKQEQIIIQEALKHMDQMATKQPISQNHDDGKNTGEQSINSPETDEWER